MSSANHLKSVLFCSTKISRFRFIGLPFLQSLFYSPLFSLCTTATPQLFLLCVLIGRWSKRKWKYFCPNHIGNLHASRAFSLCVDRHCEYNEFNALSSAYIRHIETAFLLQFHFVKRILFSFHHKFCIQSKQICCVHAFRKQKKKNKSNVSLRIRAAGVRVLLPAFSFAWLEMFIY